MTEENIIRAILVDDHPVFLEGLCLGLSNDPDVDIAATANDFAAGKELIETCDFNLLVTDLYLFDQRDGLELLRLVSEGRPDCKSVVLTYSTRPEDVLDANDAGAVAYLIKDSELAQIVRAFKTVSAGGRPPLPPSLEAALWEKARGVDRRLAGNLNDRELTVLKHMANGLKNQEIAASMFLSDRVIRRTNTSIFRKLGVRNRSEAVARAFREKII